MFEGLIACTRPPVNGDRSHRLCHVRMVYRERCWGPSPCCLRSSAGIPVGCERDAVIPSALPTQVRTLGLPPPAETPCELRVRRLAGRRFLRAGARLCPYKSGCFRLVPTVVSAGVCTCCRKLRCCSAARVQGANVTRCLLGAARRPGDGARGVTGGRGQPALSADRSVPIVRR